MRNSRHTKLNILLSTYMSQTFFLTARLSKWHICMNTKTKLANFANRIQIL